MYSRNTGSLQKKFTFICYNILGSIPLEFTNDFTITVWYFNVIAGVSFLSGTHSIAFAVTSQVDITLMKPHIRGLHHFNRRVIRHRINITTPERVTLQSIKLTLSRFVYWFFLWSIDSIEKLVHPALSTPTDFNGKIIVSNKVYDV